MARGGINKAVVQKAREALLARGINPSIDAVRGELGNTGSKTTIHRYLKEIESADPRPISAPGRLSDELTHLVSQLLQRLMEEGSAALAHERKIHDEKVGGLKKRIESLDELLAQKDRELNARDAALLDQSQVLQTSQSSLQAELTRNARISQSCSDLELRVQEKDDQVKSLEDKHAHSRDALEHYRNAVKEQREQDQRRHETQLQQIQGEFRQLRETLAVKQDELTRLNRDNERLLAESRQQAKSLHAQTDMGEVLKAQVQALTLADAKAAAMIEHHQEQVVELREEVKHLNIAGAQAGVRETQLHKQLVELQENLERRLAEGGDPNRSPPSQVSSDTTAAEKPRPLPVSRKGKKS
ncbi:DNA-binding protein [Pseudomonas sp.]|uniref:DNA-binding protein n=1 Tax=Pseudomonas sp. TaxID=306 RepID=UPI0028B1C4EB|nr:DNA-binding protein [Pseudomonas sp.]